MVIKIRKIDMRLQISAKCSGANAWVQIIQKTATIHLFQFPIVSFHRQNHSQALTGQLFDDQCAALPPDGVCVQRAPHGRCGQGRWLSHEWCVKGSLMT